VLWSFNCKWIAVAEERNSLICLQNYTVDTARHFLVPATLMNVVIDLVNPIWSTVSTIFNCLSGLAWYYSVEITVFSFKADWLFAMKYAERLFNESRWSRSTYACLKSSFLLMTDDSSCTRDHVTYLMQYVSVYFLTGHLLTFALQS